MPIDYSRYPPNWRSEIVPRIRERAGDCCEQCGVANGASLWSVPLKLQDKGRYKVKRIWVSNDSDMERLRVLALHSSDCRIKRVKVVLTVAHLDHDETNHDVCDTRLKALCQSCHLTYDAAEKYRRAMAKPETTERHQLNTRE